MQPAQHLAQLERRLRLRVPDCRQLPAHVVPLGAVLAVNHNDVFSSEGEESRGREMHLASQDVDVGGAAIRVRTTETFKDPPKVCTRFHSLNGGIIERAATPSAP